jgi:DNA-binding NtrC family response regulator
MARTGARILFADDEHVFRESVAQFLAESGYEVDAHPTGTAAWDAFRLSPHDLCVFDLQMPGMSGLELLARVIDLVPTIPVMMITAHGSMESAVEALRHGARDYITKPCDLDEILLRIERLLTEERRAVSAEILERTAQPRPLPLIGSSPALEEVRRLIAKVAGTPSTVLIQGESGTGKELVAREIHARSGLSRFVPVNCGAIPEALLESELFGHRKGSFTGAIANRDGLFRLADGGTLFLDEIGELPLSLQVKILRAIDTGEIQPIGAPGPLRTNPRILTATNKNLKDEVAAGKFREDLYYRLNVFSVAVPPLRDRREDVPHLAQHFLARFAARARKPIRGLRPDTLRRLAAYHWPGNIRELENVIERAVILSEGDQVIPEDLPAGMQDGNAAPLTDDLAAATARFERSYIRQAVTSCEGDKRRAAELLGISLSSLYRKLSE